MARAKSRKPDCVLNPGTFGGSPACHILADLMNKNVIPFYEKHKVLSFIDTAIYNFKWLSVVPEWGVKHRAMTLLRDDLCSRIDKWSYPEKFKSLSKNVVHHHYKKYLKEAAWTVAP